VPIIRTMGLSEIQTLAQATTAIDTHLQDALDSWSKDGEPGQTELELVFKAHPLGVKPSGNALAAPKNSAANMGVFGGLPDETVLVLLEWLDSTSLLSLGASCRSLYAYTMFDQLWKDLFILYAESPGFPFIRLHISCLVSGITAFYFPGSYHIRLVDFSLTLDLILLLCPRASLIYC
jgi:hypothetical protein